MERRTIAVLGLAVVVAVLVGVVLVGLGLYHYTYTSNYSYQVQLSGNGTITNATFLVPAAHLDGHSATAAVVVDGDAAYPIGRPGEPHDWTYALVDTDAGPRIRITADEISFEPRYYRWVVDADDRHERVPIPPEEFDPNDLNHSVERAYFVHVWLDSDRRVHTRTPFGDEPLLVPTATHTETTCTGGYPRARCYTYSTAMDVRYDAAPDTDVSVHVELWAGNSWIGPSLAHGGNGYTDRAVTVLVGPQSGSVPATGHIETGVGEYPWYERWRAGLR